jgi:hypothetical protein
MTIGLGDFRDPAYLRLDQLLVQPLLGGSRSNAMMGRRRGP